MVKSAKSTVRHDGAGRICLLSRLADGEGGTVVSVGGDAGLRRRLLEMGFCNGVHVQVIRRAPLGDPIEIRVRGYSLSLREEQAKHVRIAPQAPASV